MAQPEGTQLAQLNVATALDDMDSERLADFMGALTAVNRRAEQSPGFVWRLEDEAGDATGVRTSSDPRFIINLSVWDTVENLERFVWQTVHAKVYAKKTKWFERPKAQHLVMWWVPIGHQPNVAEALARLDRLNEAGPSSEAFGWESVPQAQLWKAQRCR